jgi:formiminotetrahydrofolate cyclodeaminase
LDATEPSIWTGTLSGFRERACGTDPVPASVAIAAVTASLALALLAKVLAIAGKRKNFSGDRQRLSALLDSARAESTRLTHLTDEDIRAFNEYLESAHESARKAFEVPMEAARSAIRGLGICAEASGMIRGLIASDIEGASALLTGAVRAMLLSVDSNLRYMRADEQFSNSIANECRRLEWAAGISAIPDNAVVSRSSSVLASEIDGQVVMISTTNGVFFSLDEVGGEIWGRIETSRTVGELIDGLAIAYDGDRETIARDVQAFLVRLIVKDVIRIV